VSRRHAFAGAFAGAFASVFAWSGLHALSQLGVVAALRDELAVGATLDEPPDLVESLEADVRELLNYAPEIDLALWPNFRHLDR
jgi:hypothetical protein